MRVLVWCVCVGVGVGLGGCVCMFGSMGGC